MDPTLDQFRASLAHHYLRFMEWNSKRKTAKQAARAMLENEYTACLEHLKRAFHDPSFKKLDADLEYAQSLDMVLNEVLKENHVIVLGLDDPLCDLLANPYNSTDPAFVENQVLSNEQRDQLRMLIQDTIGTMTYTMPSREAFCHREDDGKTFEWFDDEEYEPEFDVALPANCAELPITLAPAQRDWDARWQQALETADIRNWVRLSTGDLWGTVALDVMVCYPISK